MGIEARTVSRQNAAELAHWCRGRLVEERDALDETITYPGINVPTAAGVERASLGDVILQEHNGEFRIDKNEANK